MSDYILTVSKIRFYPLEPRKEDIIITDIAHALSLMTRANGHFKQFYSVAQHCINCCREAKSRGYSERVQLGCLLHDASESYISDLTRPVKKNLPAYFDIEEKLQKAIYNRFGIGDITEQELEQISEVDDALLYYEFDRLMSMQLFEHVPIIAMEHDFTQRDFVSVESEFLSCFSRLTGVGKNFKTVGIDGCKGKWIAVCLTENGFEVDKYTTIEDICKKYADADRILIDIPIGLPENKQHIRPDKLVKKELGPKSSSIFDVPCRQALYEQSKEAARQMNIDILGKSLSEQSLGIGKAIKQVDEFLESNTAWKNRLLESHPEFCFMKLNGNQPVMENKQTEEGRQKRLDILQRYYPEAHKIVQKYLSDIPARKKVDDVIDALCLAMIGRLISEWGQKTIPEKPMPDARGIQMQIVYAEARH